MRAAMASGRSISRVFFIRSLTAGGALMMTQFTISCLKSAANATWGYMQRPHSARKKMSMID